MARRRGFFAELQHQQRLAAQRQAQQQRAAVREHNRTVAAMQRAARERERAEAAAQRAAAADRARLEKEAKAAYVAQREAEAAQENALIATQLQDIEDLLAATLDVDDWVDLEALKQSVERRSFHPPGELQTPTQQPQYFALPDQPRFVPPSKPSGLGAALGGNRRYNAELSAAAEVHREHMRGWWDAFQETFRQNAVLRDRWRTYERERYRRLEQSMRVHEAAEERRLRDVEVANEKLDRLIAGLRRREPAALEEYVGIVLANSAYPECFDVVHEYSYNSEDRELKVSVAVPAPEEFPSTKSVRYVKASDEIVRTPLSATDLKRRYNNAVNQVALRTAHEVFEADREAVIDAVSLTVVADAVDPATGRDATVALLQLAVDRETFMALDLSRVEPAQTLKHLSAAVSKNPYGLVPLAGTGVRG
ncbi:MAG: hypothetical protein ACI38R_04545 [Rhodococcus sp. (in: high G+C Gram-positive bacteria)]|uniref:hypothetical protein n=2 Tax=Nocardiaceae TaxID=85025 RepID=UPI00265A3132|nr:hypothetical protein [Rhodococcus pyridinivorans]